MPLPFNNSFITAFMGDPNADQPGGPVTSPDPAAAAAAQQRRLSLFAPSDYRFPEQPAQSLFRPNLATGILAGVQGTFNAAQNVGEKKRQMTAQDAEMAFKQQQLDIQKGGLAEEQKRTKISQEQLDASTRDKSMEFAAKTGIPFTVAHQMFSVAANDPTGQKTDQLFSMASEALGLDPVASRYFRALQGTNNPEFDPIKMQKNLHDAGVMGAKLAQQDVTKGDLELSILELQRKKLAADEKSGFLSPEAKLNASVNYNQIGAHAEQVFNAELSDFAKVLASKGSTDLASTLLGGGAGAANALAGLSGPQTKDAEIRKAADRLRGLLGQADYFYAKAKEYGGDSAPRVSTPPASAPEAAAPTGPPSLFEQTPEQVGAGKPPSPDEALSAIQSKHAAPNAERPFGGSLGSVKTTQAIADDAVKGDANSLAYMIDHIPTLLDPATRKPIDGLDRNTRFNIVREMISDPKIGPEKTRTYLLRLFLGDEGFSQVK